MLTIISSTRENPAQPLCECGKPVGLTIHHDFIEGNCSCGKQYQIAINGMVWNCCANPINQQNV